MPSTMRGDFRTAHEEAYRGGAGAPGYGDHEELLAAASPYQGQRLLGETGDQSSPEGELAGQTPSNMLRLPFGGASPGAGSLGRASPRSNHQQDGFGPCLERTERIWEAALRRLDQKVASLEQVQMRLDKRASESGGTVRGLAAELQAQGRRTDAVDKRVSELRTHFQHELREKLAGVEADRDRDMVPRGRGFADSEQVAVLAQGLRHLQDVQEEVNGRLQPQEMVWEAWADLEERLNFVEGACQITPPPQAVGKRQSIQEYAAAAAAAATTPLPTPPVVTISAGDELLPSDPRLGELERQFKGVTEKLDQILAEAHGDHGWESRLHEHAVRLTSIHSKLEVRGQPIVVQSAPSAAEAGSPGSGALPGLQEARLTQVGELLAALKPQIESIQELRFNVAKFDERLKHIEAVEAFEGGRLTLEQLQQSVAPKSAELEEFKQSLANLDSHLKEYAQVAELDTLRQHVVHIDNILKSTITGVEERFQGVAEAIPQARLDQLMRIFEENGASCAALQVDLQQKMVGMEATIESLLRQAASEEGAPPQQEGPPNGGRGLGAPPAVNESVAERETRIMDGLIQTAIGKVQGVPGRSDLLPILGRIQEKEATGQRLVQELEQRRTAAEAMRRDVDGGPPGGGYGGPQQQQQQQRPVAGLSDAHEREALAQRIRTNETECKHIQEQLGSWLGEMNKLMRQLTTQFEATGEAAEGHQQPLSRGR